MTLPAGELAVYERDTVRIAVEGDLDRDTRAQLLILEARREVLWRSGEAPVREGHAAVPVEGVSPAVERGSQLLLTAVLFDDGGNRVYASDDSAAATLAKAAVRPVRVYAGRRLLAAGGATPIDLTGAPERAMAFFPVQADGTVGVLDLSGDGEVRGYVPAAARPERVAYRGGALAVLGAGGGEVTWLRPDGDQWRTVRRVELPALELELDTLTSAAVRPTARRLALGCADASCTALYALLPSGVQVLDGTVPDPARAGVLRAISETDSAQRAHPGGAWLVLPEYGEAVRGDTSVAATVFRPAAGGRDLIQRRDGASMCLATALGDVLVAAGSDGVAYAAADGSRPVCGPGTGIVRIDDAATPVARLSSLAIHNMLAEDRIGRIADLQLSDDGASLLVLGEESVAVLDTLLGVRGTLPVPGARSVAWLRGSGQHRFAVADGDGVSVYDALRLTRIARIPLGPTAGPMVYLARASGTDVIAAVIPGGFVVAPVPGP
ncbi:hypothetical protein [Longimicrobium sp.]|uniref:hypothetical protein n=1 Tax=Longimicrobium sp. TaxID=2029185 RepID=UPI002E37DE17|nr:hypothetical protein [Longimicrobium sp.]HEX6038592.1 hypothetical protein [Longimicrobium sp.]